MSKNGWTPERRKRQAEMIKNWKPWERSTGPKTEEGKEEACKLNAEKHGMRGAAWAGLRQLLKQQKEGIDEIRSGL